MSVSSAFHTRSNLPLGQPGSNASLPSLAVTIGSSTFEDKSTSWLEGIDSCRVGTSSTSVRLRPGRTAIFQEEDDEEDDFNTSAGEDREKSRREVRSRTNGPVDGHAQREFRRTLDVPVNKEARHGGRTRTNGPMDVLHPDDADAPYLAALNLKSRTSMLHDVDGTETSRKRRSQTAMLAQVERFCRRLSS